MTYKIVSDSSSNILSMEGTRFASVPMKVNTTREYVDNAQLDLAGMVENVDTLATTSQSAVEHATEKLDTIDLETLNKAIADLADVVEPLAKFFNVFH